MNNKHNDSVEKTSAAAVKKNRKKAVEQFVWQDFSQVRFCGTFRPYQQRVIDNSKKHLQDGRIHIVASPGSGKTILGLELVRMLGKPALILSPTIAIREQWKERFEQMFLPEGSNADGYVSCSLLQPKLLTSITYQGLYTSFVKMVDSRAAKKDDDESDENIQEENYSAVDIVKLVDKHQIGTICLDEAHHLRAEWQKALQEFLTLTQQKVTIVALTATPPYDSKKSEWDKYISLCGPIDEEIFVPELVRANTLCPHQDYIYYSFPTDAEVAAIKKYKQTVDQTLKEIFAEGKFLEIITDSDFYQHPDEYSDELNDNPELVKSILAFLNKNNVKPNPRFKRCLEEDNRAAGWDLSVAQILFQQMLSDDVLFTKENREYVKKVLSRQGLVEKNKVCLLTNDELEKMLFASIGKLHSISQIVDSECQSLGDNVRLLILTDYIRVNSAVLGSDKQINELGVVPVFELLRRKNSGLRLAAISGKLVIVPVCALEGILQIAQRENARIRTVPIKDTQHVELKFEGSDSSQKIGVITKAFNAGILNGIVGTKSLLGEGWDSPVINTLILASYVGSFMLSNQMRGRAIRIDKNRPDKVSNIWHLTAILPQYLLPEIEGDIPPSADYATLERRFHGFMGVHYNQNVIESTLSRASTLTAPFDEKNVVKANRKTLELALNRNAVKNRWGLALAKASNEVIVQNEILKPKKGFIPTLILRPNHYRTIRKVTYAVMRAFKELKLIDKRARPLVEKDYTGKVVNVGICRCSQYEKSIFHEAISQVLSPIDSPRYVLVKTKNDKQDFRCAFAVPEIFSTKKDNAEIFRKKMSRRIATFEAFYTRSDSGKKALAAAKKKAYVNKTNNEIQAKMKLKPK